MGWVGLTQDDKLIRTMRDNPKDWKIGDVERACRLFGINCSAPSRGSHYKLQHPKIRGILTVPARKPIKPIYIKLLLEMIDSLENMA